MQRDKLLKSFYQKPALDIATEFLGKYLVRKTSDGIISGKIIDIEAYPAFTDNVSHANKKTKRTEIIWGPGGYVYIYLIYGIHHQFSIVVNKKDIPEVIFIRALQPEEGIDLMRKYFGRETKNDREFTKSPGNLCKALNITKEMYGEDITGDSIWLEDRGIQISPKNIKAHSRVGINEELKGSDKKYRYSVLGV